MVTKAPRPVEFVVADMEAKGIYTDDQIDRVRGALERVERTLAAPRPSDDAYRPGVGYYG